MKRYERPYITLISIDAELMQYSEVGPGAGDIGSPGFGAKESVWDEEIEDTHY